MSLAGGGRAVAIALDEARRRSLRRPHKRQPNRSINWRRVLALGLNGLVWIAVIWAVAHFLHGGR
jgi:hypothetical protein